MMATREFHPQKMDLLGVEKIQEYTYICIYTHTHTTLVIAINGNKHKYIYIYIFRYCYIHVCKYQAREFNGVLAKDQEHSG